MSVLLWPQYIRRGTFFVSRKGTFSNALLLLPGDMSVRLRDQWKYFETKQTVFLHDECTALWPVEGTSKLDKHLWKGKLFNILQRYPSLNQRTFHVKHTGATIKPTWGKCFLRQLLPQEPRDLLVQDRFGIHGLMLTFNLLDSNNIIRGKSWD